MFTSERNVIMVIFYLKIFEVVFKILRVGSVGVIIQ